MTNIIKTLSLIIISFCLYCCDIIYGASRHSSIKKIPSNICVKKVLEKFPEIKNIKYQRDRFDSNTKGYIAGKYSTTYRYSYELNGFPINLSFEEFDDISKPKTYSSSFGMMHHIPPQNLVDEFMLTSDKIEKLLERECNLDIATHMSKKCSKELICGRTADL